VFASAVGSFRASLSSYFHDRFFIVFVVFNRFHPLTPPHSPTPPPELLVFLCFSFSEARTLESEMPKKDVTVNDDIPTSTLLSEVSEIEVLDIKGVKVKFGKLIEGKKTIVVFIRTFIIRWY
jgi:hypothetical protein